MFTEDTYRLGKNDVLLRTVPPQNRILASIALLASFLLPIMALSGQFPAPGMNLHIFWTMVVMHCVAALILVSLLTRLALTSKREHQTFFSRGLHFQKWERRRKG